MLFLRLGWTNVLITNPRDFPRFVTELSRYPFAFLSGVNTLFNALLHNSEFRESRFQSSENHARRRHGRAGNRGAALEGGYRKSADPGLGIDGDLTRAPASICRSTDFNGSIGLPIASTEISIRDDAGAEVASRRARRDLRARPAGDARLLEPTG